MNKFKYYDRVRISKPGDRWHEHLATVKGHLCDGICYLELDRGLTKRNGKPQTQTMAETYLVKVL
ncbi:hypothetical protein C7B80_33075 [Cyanosarcina cf. burmensis CCALA 770]|nr:hypothetical protein C7B80_33075 [Cyanosarcina cf. burmensis CCALA 770]